MGSKTTRSQSQKRKVTSKTNSGKSLWFWNWLLQNGIVSYISFNINIPPPSILRRKRAPREHHNSNVIIFYQKTMSRKNFNFPPCSVRKAFTAISILHLTFVIICTPSNIKGQIPWFHIDILTPGQTKLLRVFFQQHK